MNRRFLNVRQVQTLHAIAMQAFGRPPYPLRDPGALEAAVTRVRQVAAYGSRVTTVYLAAVLAVSIDRAQAYSDGNKRTAYMAVGAFLRINGYDVNMDDGGVAMAAQLEAIAERTIEDRRSLDAATRDFATWLNGHATRRGARRAATG